MIALGKGGPPLRPASQALCETHRCTLRKAPEGRQKIAQRFRACVKTVYRGADAFFGVRQLAAAFPGRSLLRPGARSKLRARKAQASLRTPKGQASSRQTRFSHRRFSAGVCSLLRASPVGTAEGGVSAVPTGLIIPWSSFPAMNRWAIFSRPYPGLLMNAERLRRLAVRKGFAFPVGCSFFLPNAPQGSALRSVGKWSSDALAESRRLSAQRGGKAACGIAFFANNPGYGPSTGVAT